MKNIHVLPTDKPSRLIQAPNDILILLVELAENNEYNLNKHIYITSDEEIKKGDYGLVVNEILSYNKMIELWGVTQGWKIILTTDQDLIKDGVQAIDDEFLEWFVKNPSCEEVVFSTYHVKGDISGKLHYQIIIPKEDGIDFMANELVIEKERMYSEEDMVKSFIAGVDCNSSGGKNFEQFIEQLKNK